MAAGKETDGSGLWPAEAGRRGRPPLTPSDARSLSGATEGPGAETRTSLGLATRTEIAASAA
ncbi:hypothetical protein PSMK_16970 [Phycisphaera mikurensis NBRC 102666]|uniref:Uncharacterized protein n=1 Tax=Phycisphaera mikurensis (strain NBRC 102666 / KCTC 22515 / FYK2301M01) TaxID=1142394 RepID=I0IF18_PHYMF|nr:hypothetical protein PSMK_16970 [Phycisphaera mikurensis NBRC 102666]